MAAKQRKTFPIGGSAEYHRRKDDPKYFFYEEYFTQRPLLGTDYLIASKSPTLTQMALVLRGNRNLDISGNSATTALCTALEGGGITLTTAGADEDEMVVAAHADSDQSSLLGMNWDSANEPYIRADILLGATITTMMAKVCFASNAGAVDQATAELHLSVPADQFGFMFATTNAGATLGSIANWVTNSSRTGTDVSTDTGVVAAASTLVRLEAYLDKDRIPQYYINGDQVSTADATALTAVATLDFYLEVMEEGAGAARAMSIRNFAVSQLYG